jgi:hypothetical protein
MKKAKINLINPKRKMKNNHKKIKMLKLIKKQVNKKIFQIDHRFRTKQKSIKNKKNLKKIKPLFRIKMSKIKIQEITKI